MKTSIPSKVIGIIILFVSAILLPIFFISIVEWREDANRIQTASRDFIDKVIDAGQITEDMESDLNLYLASCTGVYVYTITVETKVTNPVIDVDGKITGYETKWMPRTYEKNTMLQKGDIVTLKVEQTNFSLFQKFATGLLGVSYNKMECITPGMVR